MELKDFLEMKHREPAADLEQFCREKMLDFFDTNKKKGFCTYKGGDPHGS